MAVMYMRDPNTGVMVPLMGGVDKATADAKFVTRSGGAINGTLTGQKPTAAKHAATRDYAMHWVPVGGIMGFAGNYVPQGNWLHCNGQAVDRRTYSNLFAVCSTQFGAGDGSLTFNVPNCMDRSAIAVYPSYAGMDTVGAAAGATTVTLARANMPNSSGTWSIHGGGSRTSLANTYGGTGATTASAGIAQYANPQYDQTGAQSIGIANIVYGGGGGTHPNVQPSLTMHFMIKF